MCSKYFINIRDIVIQGEQKGDIFMACYVNGVTPSNGNVQTDSVGVTNTQTDLQEIQSRMQQAQLEKRTAEQRERFKQLNQLYKNAKEEFSALESKQLEEMEKKFDEEKTRLEIELELERIKSTPEYYSSMGTVTLMHEYFKAFKENSPNLPTIRKEINNRLTELIPRIN